VNRVPKRESDGHLVGCPRIICECPPDDPPNASSNRVAEQWCDNCHGRGLFGLGGDISTCGKCGGSGKLHATRNRMYPAPTPEQNERIISILTDMEFTPDEVDAICHVFTQVWIDG
jgi:hypothetical protein